MYMSLHCRCSIAVSSHDYSPKSLVEGGRPKAAPLGTKRRALVFVGRLKAALYPERFLQLCFPAPLTLSFQGPLITSTRSTSLSVYFSSPSLQQNHRARTSWARLWRALISSIYIYMYSPIKACLRGSYFFCEKERWGLTPGSSTRVPWVTAPFAFSLPLGKLGARVPLWHPPLPLGMLGARVPTRHRHSSGSSFALSLLLACLWLAFSMPLACL